MLRGDWAVCIPSAHTANPSDRQANCETASTSAMSEYCLSCSQRKFGSARAVSFEFGEIISIAGALCHKKILIRGMNDGDQRIKNNLIRH